MLFTIAGRLSPEAIIFLSGVSILHYGIEFANQAIDYMEDKAGGSGIMGLAPAVFFLLTMPIILAGYYIPVSGLWKMYRASITRPLDEAIGYMKMICRYNQWQASGLLGLMVVSGMMFFGAMHA